MPYSNYDLVRLEARLYAIERYIKEHNPEGSWFLDQEYHRYLSVVAARKGSSEDFDRTLRERQAHEEVCRQQGIEMKNP